MASHSEGDPNRGPLPDPAGSGTATGTDAGSLGRGAASITLRPPPSLPATKRPKWLVMLAAVILVVCLCWQVPKEIGRWYLAAAEESYLDNEMMAALANADRAIRWDSYNVWLFLGDSSSAGLYRRRAELKLQIKDLIGSLADCNRAVELASRDTWGYQLRSRVFQRMRCHVEAIQDCTMVVELTKEKSFNALNGRAYARALANMEIKEGLADIQMAFKLLKHQNDNAMLDTRGYLHYLDGNLSAALRDMERAVSLAKKQTDAERARLKFAMRYQVDQRELKQASLVWDHHMAVLYHHRGLVYQKLGNVNDAFTDLRRAKELGYNPDEGVW